MRILTGSLNLAKITTDKIQTKNKNGEPYSNGAKYLNIQIIEHDEPDEYGNAFAILINQTAEERQAKAPKVYLGNAKVIWKSDNKPEPPKAPEPDWGDAAF